MKDNESDAITIDDICHQSLHFLQASNEELMNKIANKKLSKDIFANVDKQNVDPIDGQTTEEEEQSAHYPVSKDSDEERAQTPENDLKVYNLATEKKIDSLVTEYKKYKTQLSPIPPNAGCSQTQKRSVNERQGNSTERYSEKFTLKDSQAIQSIGSDILAFNTVSDNQL